MAYQYMVQVFVPQISGCGATDQGWDAKRCGQYQSFLNQHASGGWRLHSSEYRQVTASGCGGRTGVWLVCVFEKAAP